MLRKKVLAPATSCLSTRMSSVMNTKVFAGLTLFEMHRRNGMKSRAIAEPSSSSFQTSKVGNLSKREAMMHGSQLRGRLALQLLR